MLTVAAVLPHPPLLVPEVASGAAAELDGLRAACTKALNEVLDAPLDRLVVVAGGAEPATYGPGSRGTLQGFGVPLDASVPGAAPSGEPVLPLAATVACWLLAQHDVSVPVSVEVVATDQRPTIAFARGAELAASETRVGMLAMGDGSAALTTKAPGYLVDGAEAWQREVSRALGAADLATLASLDSGDAAEYLAGGLAAWQVLAGAATASSGRWNAELLADEAPYGVAYTVACWRLDGAR
jgi:hypothetical protein